MKPLQRAVLLGVVQLTLVASLGVKLVRDRATLPRVWARTGPVDPDMPIRGRYVELSLQASTRSGAELHGAVAVLAENGRLVVIPDPLAHRALGSSRVYFYRHGSGEPGLLNPPVAFFLPEHVPDPSRRRPGEELWAEVSVPERGPPRPIRLGVKRGNGPITPL